MSGAKNNNGKLFVISAPSGAGKTTLVREIMSADPSLQFSVSYTTRPQRHNEAEGEAYHFVSKEVFAGMLADGDFLEHAEVFDNDYGTSRHSVKELLASGSNVLLEIDWQGAEQVRRNMPECETIFILPPSVTVLEKRLRGRATDSDDVIARRMADSLADLGHWANFNYAVINDELAQAVGALQTIIAGNGGAHKTTADSIKDAAKQLLN
ncbi:MAG: guanylate kinase [Gammaproteobacteria bacterium]|jgi:guanylate kinase|tara:strand:+ start:2741 stop:3370 length:630 start_codon:yes stop_codon:yes gene_type:complete